MTNEQALSIWAVLGGASSGRELNETDLAIRARLIADLDFDAAQEAAARLARISPWLPSVAQLRDEVLAADIPDAGLAWQEVCSVVQRLGWCTPPGPGHFSHPVVHAAVRALGPWQDFCAADPNVSRAHWLKLYPAVAARVRRDIDIADTQDLRRDLDAGGDRASRAFARLAVLKQLEPQPQPVQQRDGNVDADGFHVAELPTGIADDDRRHA